MYLKMAVSNLWRNKRRTIITELSLIFGIVVIITVGSLTRGITEAFARSGIEVFGSMQVEHIDYEKERKFKPLETTLTDSRELIARIEAFPGVIKASGQLSVTGFISNGSKSATFFGTGYDKESSTIALPGLGKTIHEGRSARPGSNEINLGKTLAENLNLKLGDSVMLLAGTIKGGLNMVELVYVGNVWAPGIPDVILAHLASMNLGTVQKLLGMPDRVSRIAIAYEDFDNVQEGAGDLQQLLNRNSATPLIVKDYSMFLEGFEFMKFLDLTRIVIALVIFIMVGAGIANAMFMSVMERRKEIGTIKAIGAGQWTIKWIFILEGFVTAAVGVFLGLIMGVGLVWGIINLGGIPIMIPGSATGLDILPVLDYSSCRFAIILAIAVSLVASYFPASVSARLDPVQTLREE